MKFILPWSLAAILMVLGGCQPERTAEEDDRSNAIGELNFQLGRQFLGPSVVPIAKCIVEHSSRAEIRKFSEARTRQNTFEDKALIEEVLNRPQTKECVLSKGRYEHVYRSSA